MPFKDLPILKFFKWLDEVEEDSGYFKLSEHHLTRIDPFGTMNEFVWITGDKSEALVVEWKGSGY